LPSFHLPAGKELFPSCFPGASCLVSTRSAQVRPCHLLPESPLLALHDDEGSRVTGCGHTWCSRRGETAPLLPGGRVHSLRQPTINPASSLFPSSVQVLPVVVPPASAMLVLCQRDERRMRDHLLAFPAPANTARGKCKERSMGRWGPHASASSLAARTSSGLCRRSRTCTVTLLAVHAASGHEAGGDGWFPARHHRQLPLYGAVPSAPPHAAPWSATGKREDRLPAALALAVDARITAGGGLPSPVSSSASRRCTC